MEGDIYPTVLYMLHRCTVERMVFRTALYKGGPKVHTEVCKSCVVSLLLFTAESPPLQVTYSTTVDRGSSSMIKVLGNSWCRLVIGGMSRQNIPHGVSRTVWVAYRNCEGQHLLYLGRDKVHFLFHRLQEHSSMRVSTCAARLKQIAGYTSTHVQD